MKHWKTSNKVLLAVFAIVVSIACVLDHEQMILIHKQNEVIRYQKAKVDIAIEMIADLMTEKNDLTMLAVRQSLIHKNDGMTNSEVVKWFKNKIENNELETVDDYHGSLGELIHE
jgi:hypothetical protein